jgi:hypothetical protein
LQLTYSPVDWFRAGLAAQRTAAFPTSLVAQPGFLLGFSRKNWEFTTYIYTPGMSDVNVVLEVGVNF